jgi:hypothetical protein
LSNKTSIRSKNRTKSRTAHLAAVAVDVNHRSKHETHADHAHRRPNGSEWPQNEQRSPAKHNGERLAEPAQRERKVLDRGDRAGGAAAAPKPSFGSKVGA